MKKEKSWSDFRNNSQYHDAQQIQEKIEGQRAGATSAPSASLTIYDDGFKFTEPNDETNSHAGWTYMYAAFA